MWRQLSRDAVLTEMPARHRDVFETDYRKLRRSCSSDRARVAMQTPLFDRNRNNAHYR